MRPVARLAREIAQLRRALPPAAFRSYCLELARRIPAVCRARSLVPVDRAMRGTVAFRVGGQSIDLPLDVVARLLGGHDDTPTFGGAREMYANNVYLRGFRPGITARSVVDLGSNRGLFLLLGAKVLGATTLIGVEPQGVYTPVFAALAQANGIRPGACTRDERLAGPVAAPGTVTLAEIMATHGLDRIGFLKCDIEGGEFDVLGAPDAPLDRIDNLALELHPEDGDVCRLAGRLHAGGLDLISTDQLGRAVPVERAGYLYASRVGGLASRGRLAQDGRR